MSEAQARRLAAMLTERQRQELFLLVRVLIETKGTKEALYYE